MSSLRNPDQVLDVIQQAARLHAAGRLAEAEPLYRQALNRSPDNFDALHLYGVLLSQTQRFDEAEKLLRRAVYLRPNVATAQSNLGNMLRDRNRPGEALPYLRRAVEADPKMAAAHQNLGAVLNALGESDEAEQSFRRALELQPDFPEALNSLGNALRLAEKLEESEKCYRRAIARRPNYSEAHTGLGATLNALHRNEESVASCRRAVELRGDYPEARNNLALALLSQKAYQEAEVEVRTALRLRSGYVDAQRNLGAVLSGMRRYDEALLEYKRALEMDPESGGIWMDLGSVQRHLRQFDAAKDSCRRAIELNPTSPLEYFNLGVVHLDLCEIDQAIDWFRKAVEVKPTAPLPHWGLALALLVDGQYIEGWQEYEWRWECKDFYPPRREFKQPAWTGADPTGQKVLLYPEQGLGDAIQFVRYAPLLSRRGATVIVQCAASMKRLFATLPGIQAIYSEPEPAPAFDMHCSLLSLPMMLKTTVETIPAEVPYLRAEPASAATWKQKLASISGKLKVGIAWAGNPEHQRDQDRSCGLALFAPLGQMPDMAWISLQKGPAATQAANPPPGLTLHDFTSELADFADTAALIANLDLVISVDTSVAHLAGAMGKPVWTLLAFAPDWRWLLNRAASPWYPTMRLFRQKSPGDWKGIVEDLAEALSIWSKIPSARTLPESQLALGNALRDDGQIDQAIAAFRQAIVLNPKFAEAYGNLGAALQHQGQLEESAAAFRQALAINPNLAHGHSNLGTVLEAQGQMDLAIAAYRQGIAVQRDSPIAHHNLALALLLLGDFRQGWEEYEWRWKCKDFPSNRLNFPQPQWDGSNLNGRTILLYPEQGLGDTIQFVRYVPLVAERGGKVIFGNRALMERLLQSIPGVEKWVAPGEALPPFDLHCPLLSLARAFGTTLESIPASVPYLFPDAKLRESWRTRLTAYPAELRVGLAWAGRPTHKNNRNRSMNLADLAPLLRLPGVRFISLQKGEAAAQATTLPEEERLVDWTQELQDFADTAALIANLDLVISVDTAVAHLAGAMGKPVWTLLPFAPDWRWLLHRDDSPWYPTMRLFRQRSPGDWRSVIDRVAEAMKGFSPHGEVRGISS